MIRIKKLKKQRELALPGFLMSKEKKFRDREYQILSKVMEMENCVISTGGGIILEEKNRKLLEKGTVVYLQTSIQSQLERTMNDKERPLLQGNINKEETLRKIASERNPVYEALTDITIQETNTPDESVNAIIKELIYNNGNDKDPNKFK